MKPISQAHLRVIDHGLFLPVARRLARAARKVSYWTPTEKAFPSVKDLYGYGFPEIERVEDPEQDKESVDCFVFPDIGFAHMQVRLAGEGFPVWGNRHADSLEIYRGKFLKALSTTKLPVPPHKVFAGMEALKAHLRKVEDKWIKVSRFRGDWETMHWVDWDQSKDELLARELKLGPFADELAFFVFDKIDTEIEDGYDGYHIKGQWPAVCVHGMEAKDRGYLGTFQKFSELPPELRCINEEFGPVLASYGGAGKFSSEARITTEGETYFIDPTIRFGSPPHQVECELYANLPEVIYAGAHGQLVNPKPAFKFGVQGLLCLSGDRNAWRKVRVPKELDQWVKCGSCMLLDGKLSFPPDPERTDNTIGWLVGVGDTIEAALDHLKANTEKLPDGLSCEFIALAELLKEVQEAQKLGMEMTKQEVPAPEVVIQ